MLKEQVLQGDENDNGMTKPASMPKVRQIGWYDDDDDGHDYDDDNDDDHYWFNFKFY